MARILHPQIATANDLFSGNVIYLTKHNSWSEELEDAAVASTPEDGENLLALASTHENKIVGPYLADVQLDADGIPTPVHFRESFRTRGPSNYFHGKQAEVSA